MLARSLPGEHGGRLAGEVEVGLAADVDHDPLDDAAGESVRAGPGIVVGDGRAAVPADAQALAGQLEVARLVLDTACSSRTPLRGPQGSNPARAGPGYITRDG